MSVHEAAAALDVHWTTVYKWVREGRIKARKHPVKRHGSITIPKSEIDRLLAGDDE